MVCNMTWNHVKSVNVQVFYFCRGCIVAFKTVGSNLGAGILMIVVALFFSVSAIAELLVLRKV